MYFKNSTMIKNKNILLQIVVFLGLLFIQQTAISQTAFTRLVWSDEFNYNGAPDSLKWSYENGNGCPENCGWGNNELENYTSRPQNVIVQNGVLKITAIKEKYNGSDYTSSRILTKGKLTFKCNLRLLLFLFPLISFSQNFITNTFNRNTISLYGSWKYIVDPYETGYY